MSIKIPLQNLYHISHLNAPISIKILTATDVMHIKNLTGSYSTNSFPTNCKYVQMNSKKQYITLMLYYIGSKDNANYIFLNHLDFASVELLVFFNNLMMGLLTDQVRGHFISLLHRWVSTL